MLELFFLNPRGRKKVKRKATKKKTKRGHTRRRSSGGGAKRRVKSTGRKPRRTGMARKRRLSAKHRAAISRGLKRSHRKVSPARAAPKRRRRTYKRNAWYGQPRRHATAARKGYRRKARRTYRRNPNGLGRIRFLPTFAEIQDVLAGAAGFAGARGISGQIATFLPVNLRPSGVEGSATPKGFNAGNMVGLVMDFSIATIGTGLLGGFMPPRMLKQMRTGALIATGFNFVQRTMPQIAQIPILGPGFRGDGGGYGDYVAREEGEDMNEMSDYVAREEAPLTTSPRVGDQNEFVEELESSGAAFGQEDDLPGSGAAFGQWSYAEAP